MTHPFARALAMRWVASAMRLNRRVSLVTAAELEAFERGLSSGSPERAGP